MRTAAWFVSLLTLFAASAVNADELRSKGTALKGTVKNVSAKEVVFETEYGKGALTVAIEDVEALTSDSRVIVVHGPSGKTSGRVLGLRDGRLIVGDDDASAVEIDLAAIHAFVGIEGPQDTFANNMRRRLALWDGAFDLGFGLTRSSTDTTIFSAGFLADRKKKPTRLTFQTGYRYGKQKTEGEEETDDDVKTTTENEILGLLRGEYDFAPRWFTFGSIDGEYDEIESLSLRTVPKAGVGYRFWEAENGLFQLEAGGAYVYEKFFVDDDNGYFSIVFGKLLEYDLPYFGSHFHWRTDYLPAIDDWAGDYLLRSEAGLLVPMYRYLSFKLAVADEYDSSPADGAVKNTFKSTAGIALVY